MARRHAPVAPIPDRVTEKLLTNVEPGPGDCIFTRQSRGSHGYGQIGYTEGGVEYAGTTHRTLWLALRGPIPEGSDVHHTCFNRPCVNIEHLALMPAFENRRRHSGQDWGLGVCKFGHPNEGMVTLSCGKRRCGDCHRAEQARGHARHRAKKRKEATC